MSYSEDIDNALMAHGEWKKRLGAAIESGSSEFTVSQVQVDNGCAFGKWFYGLPSDLRESDQGKKIQRLHAAFHAEAARILDLALKGRIREATKAIESGSQFVSISGQLAITLTQWKKTIGNG